MSDQSTAETESAGSEVVDGEGPAEEAGAEPEKEPTPPIELNLPPEVAEALSTVMSALETFGATVKPFLDESHANAAEAAGAADPLYMPEGLATIEGIVGEWSRKVDGQIDPLKTYIARIEREREPIADYLAGLKAIFADAPPPPPPPPPPGEGDEGG